MATLRGHLDSALNTTFRIERELAGGGMSMKINAIIRLSSGVALLCVAAGCAGEATAPTAAPLPPADPGVVLGLSPTYRERPSTVVDWDTVGSRLIVPAHAGSSVRSC